MSTQEAKKLQDELASYNLTGRLFDRLQVVIHGGCAKSTMYKAFQSGSKTPLLERILTTAQEILREHEELIAEFESQQPQPATA